MFAFTIQSTSSTNTRGSGPRVRILRAFSLHGTVLRRQQPVKLMAARAPAGRHTASWARRLGCDLCKEIRGAESARLADKGEIRSVGHATAHRNAGPEFAEHVELRDAEHVEDRLHRVPPGRYEGRGAVRGHRGGRPPSGSRPRTPSPPHRARRGGKRAPAPTTTRAERAAPSTAPGSSTAARRIHDRRIGARLQQSIGPGPRWSRRGIQARTARCALPRRRAAPAGSRRQGDLRGRPPGHRTPPRGPPSHVPRRGAARLARRDSVSASASVIPAGGRCQGVSAGRSVRTAPTPAEERGKGLPGRGGPQVARVLGLAQRLAVDEDLAAPHDPAGGGKGRANEGRGAPEDLHGGRHLVRDRPPKGGVDLLEYEPGRPLAKAPPRRFDRGSGGRRRQVAGRSIDREHRTGRSGCGRALRRIFHRGRQVCRWKHIRRGWQVSRSGGGASRG